MTFYAELQSEEALVDSQSGLSLTFYNAFFLLYPVLHSTTTIRI